MVSVSSDFRVYNLAQVIAEHDRLPIFSNDQQYKIHDLESGRFYVKLQKKDLVVTVMDQEKQPRRFLSKLYTTEQLLQELQTAFSSEN